jgi:Helicase associated domain
MGFDFNDRRNIYDWEAVLLALQTYKHRNGHLMVPFSFKVPQGDIQWPEKSWGMNLGNVVSSIRTKNYYLKHHDELRTMGFEFKKLVNRTTSKK